MMLGRRQSAFNAANIGSAPAGRRQNLRGVEHEAMTVADFDVDMIGSCRTDSGSQESAPCRSRRPAVTAWPIAIDGSM